MYSHFPGLTLKPEWSGSGTELVSVVVNRVEEEGVADALGVNEGDEVVLVNDTSVLELGWEKIMTALLGM